MIFHTDERFDLLDDIPEEYCGFVRHLLLQYISKRIVDHMIDTMGDLISYFHSLKSEVQLENPKTNNR